MKPETCFQRLIRAQLPESFSDLVDELTDEILPEAGYFGERSLCAPCLSCQESFPSMGLSAGGKMRQEIYVDPYDVEAWDLSKSHRCFVHICNSMQWRQITGSNPPHPPLTAREYRRHGIPWFDYYRDDLQALEGSAALNSVKSVAQLHALRNEKTLSEEFALEPHLIIQHGNNLKPNSIRECVP